MKIGVSVPKKHRMSFRADVSDAFNLNTGILLTKDVKIVQQELIILTKDKDAKLVRFKHLFGMVNIALNVHQIHYSTNKAESVTIVQTDLGYEVMVLNVFRH